MCNSIVLTVIFIENITMLLYKTFQTGTNKMVIYDACLQDTIIMLTDATLSEEDFLALCVYVCGAPVVCQGVPQNDQWLTCSPVLSCLSQTPNRLLY